MASFPMMRSYGFDFGVCVLDALAPFLSSPKVAQEVTINSVHSSKITLIFRQRLRYTNSILSICIGFLLLVWI